MLMSCVSKGKRTERREICSWLGYGDARQVNDGVIREEEAVKDVGQFGIDEEAAHDEDLMRHLQEQGANPFDDYTLDRLNEVPCELPLCLLTQAQVDELGTQLAAKFNINTHDMAIYSAIWNRALVKCCNLF